MSPLLTPNAATPSARTRGSCVADEVLENLLDGTEFDESHPVKGPSSITLKNRGSDLDNQEQPRQSYLCRIVDVLIGREVLTRLHDLVGEWISAFEDRNE